MNLRDLQYLVAVVDHQHFSKAAQACHVSQPTLSMQLKKLEEYLGVTLLERSNRQIMVTPIGKNIVERARRILEESAAIQQAAKAAQDPYTGDFRLGAFPTLAPYFLPLLAPLIRKKLPKLKLLLIEEKTAQLQERLKAGTLDAALIALPLENDDFESVTLFEDPFLLAVPLNHPLAARTSIEQHDIAHEQLLLLEDGHCLRNQALEVCSLIGTSEHQDFRATSLETLRQMVASGVGITFIPKLAVKKNDGIAYIPFAKPTASRTIGLVWRRTSARQPCIDVLVKLMTDLV